MTAFVSPAFVAQFDAEVKAAYQGASKLGGTVRTKNGVIGSTYRFPKISKGIATPKISQTEVVPMGLVHSNVTATLSDWNAAEYSDVYDLAKLNFDERTPIKQAVADGIGRRFDQLIIDAANAGASNTTADAVIGTATGSTVLSSTKLRRAKRLMDAAGVPSSDRFFALSASALEGLLAETAVTSADFNSVKALVDGSLDTWLGFKFIMIEDRSEGGLSLVSTVRTNLAFHKAALGLAVGMDMRTEMNYIADKTSWLINGLFSAGSVAIESSAVIKVLSVE